MKIAHKTSFLVFLFFASLISVEGATITWLGGNGAWENSSNWDSGTVPSYGDDVIIPSGYCYIYNGDQEGATSVEVQSSARLFIYDGGHLEIQGAIDNDGLHNMGRVYIYGSLAINDISRSSTSVNANAILNEKYIFTYSNSIINIKYIEDDAIHNTITNSYFRVRGALYIYAVEERAIFNQDRFYNSGIIDISESGESTSYLIVTSDQFRNYSGGVINLDSDIYGGISNSSSSTLINYGDINIGNVSIGINNNGYLTNYSGALIDSYDNASNSYHNRLGGTIINHGTMRSTDSGSGIYNYGDFENHKSFWVFYSQNWAGIRNFPTGSIDNYHDIYLLADSDKDIENQGDITNRNGGIIEMNKSIDMSTGSSISNYGFLVSYGNVSHNINGSFGNKGVIDDNQGLLQGLFPNDRLIVAPISSPMQVGVPYPNVLDVASLDGLDVGDWKVSQTGAIAGTYNGNTNVFTPNANAAGISTIYISILDLVSGFSRIFTLEIDSPILPFAGEKQLATTRNEIDDENSSIKDVLVQVYPNPSQGSIQLESNAFAFHTTQIQIFNTMGKLVQQERLNAGSTSHNLDFSNQLSNGIYIMKMIQNEKEISIERIQLFR